MIAIEKQDLRHAKEGAAQGQLDQQSPIRADLVGDERRVLQRLPADQTEDLAQRRARRRAASRLDGARAAAPNAVWS
jgi:hypothetical protein